MVIIRLIPPTDGSVPYEPPRVHVLPPVVIPSQNEIPEDAKFCRKCYRTLPKTEFGRSSGRKDGLSFACKACIRAAARQKYHSNADYRAYLSLWHRANRYGITAEQVMALVEAQEGVCAICRLPPTGKRNSFHVDHDHETGQVRGLLCSPCNSGIGNLRDDPELLRKALAYLEHYGKK